MPLRAKAVDACAAEAFAEEACAVRAARAVDACASRVCKRAADACAEEL